MWEALDLTPNTPTKDLCFLLTQSDMIKVLILCFDCV